MNSGLSYFWRLQIAAVAKIEPRFVIGEIRVRFFNDLTVSPRISLVDKQTFSEAGTNNIISKVQRNKAQQSF